MVTDAAIRIGAGWFLSPQDCYAASVIHLRARVTGGDSWVRRIRTVHVRVLAFVLVSERQRVLVIRHHSQSLSARRVVSQGGVTVAMVAMVPVVALWCHHRVVSGMSGQHRDVQPILLVFHSHHQNRLTATRFPDAARRCNLPALMPAPGAAHEDTHPQRGLPAF